MIETCMLAIAYCNLRNIIDFGKYDLDKFYKIIAWVNRFIINSRIRDVKQVS